jgi:hypothetical protein
MFPEKADCMRTVEHIRRTSVLTLRVRGTVIDLGFNGLGETGTSGTAAAIANAVWSATGTRQRSLPIRLDCVLEPAGMEAAHPAAERQ